MQEFCIKNEELCIKNEELCIKNEELCIKNEELRIKNEELRIKNEELRIKNEDFWMNNDECCSLSSLLQFRFDEGFTVSHCELTIYEADPMDIDAACKWGLSLRLQTVWEPLQTGIEWRSGFQIAVEES